MRAQQNTDDPIDSLRRGARAGASAWLIYGVVETIFAVIVPCVLNRRVVVPVNLGVIAFVFLLYPAVGGLCGAASAWLLRLTKRRSSRSTDSSSLFSSAALASVLIVFMTNAALAHRAMLAAPGVAAAGALAVLRLWRAPRQGSHQVLAYVTHPWVACMLLVGITYAREPRDPLSPLMSEGLAAALAIGVLVGAVIWAKAVLPFLRHRNWSRHLRWAAPAAPMLILAIAAALRASDDASWAAPSRQQGIQLPNVILISLDTVRADHTSLYGYARDTTPHLRQLAGEATLFTQAFSASNETLASHGSIFTGMSATHHGAIPFLGGQLTTLYESRPTLPEMLANLGYWTVGIVANAGRLVPELGFGRGFDYYDNRTASGPLGPTKPYFLLQPIKTLLGRALGRPEEGVIFYRDAREITAEAVGVLRGAAQARVPLFLFVNYLDAHWPYAPPQPFADRYPGRIPEYDWSEPAQYPVSSREIDHLTSQYDAEIAYLDDQLGQFIGELKRLGVLDNTLLIVTSDHGESLGEHQHLFHARTLYHEELHVPLIVKYPRVRQPAVVTMAAGGADILPTVLDAIGQPIPDGLDGRSLRQVTAGRYVISAGFSVLPGHPVVPAVAALSETMTLIRTPAGPWEMYERELDPGELRNTYVASALPEWQAALLNVQRESLRPGPPLINSDVRERLRSLGYVQ